MFKKFMRLNWVCLLLGIIGFVVSAINHTAPATMHNFQFSMIYDLVCQGIVVCAMLTSVYVANTSINKNHVLEQLGTYQKLNNRRFTVIFSSVIIILLDGILLRYFSATSTAMSAVLVLSAINGFEIFSLFELLYIVACGVKIINLD